MHWASNQLADRLADKGSQEAALPNEVVDEIKALDRTSHDILRRLTRIAVLIVPDISTRTHPSNQHVSSTGKLEKVSKWAKASGHSLTAAYKCVKCGLQLNLNSSATTLESILTMPCVGTLGQELLKHNGVCVTVAISLYTTT